jgi:hypothetical protein
MMRMAYVVLFAALSGRARVVTIWDSARRRAGEWSSRFFYSTDVTPFQLRRRGTNRAVLTNGSDSMS